MQRYNDYELIYLAKSENCEAAISALVNKYKNMVYKFIHLYYVNERDYDDYYQEGLIMLFKAIDSFNEAHNKTFTRYFELILRRRIIYLKNKEPKYELHDEFHMYKDNNLIEDEFVVEGLTSFEEVVFKRYFVKNQKISFIAESENKSSKQIYNAIYRIKNKYKDNML